MAFHSSDAVAGAYGLLGNSPAYDDSQNYFDFRRHSGNNARGIMVLKFEVSGISSGDTVDQATILFTGASDANDFTDTEFYVEDSLSELTLNSSSPNRPRDILANDNGTAAAQTIALYNNHANDTLLALDGSDVENFDEFHTVDFTAALQALVDSPSWSDTDQPVALVFYGLLGASPLTARVYSPAEATASRHPEIHVTYTEGGGGSGTELPGEDATSDLSLTSNTTDSPHLVLIGAGQLELYIQPQLDKAAPLETTAGQTLPDQEESSDISFTAGGTRAPIYSPAPDSIGTQDATSNLALTNAGPGHITEAPILTESDRTVTEPTLPLMPTIGDDTVELFLFF